MAAPYRRAAIVVAMVALVFGLVGLVVARDLSFTADRGALVGSLMSFNPLSAVVTIVLCAVTLVGAWLGIRSVVTAAGAGFGLAALVQLVQLGKSSNFLGGRPSTFSFFLGIAVGLLMIGRVVWPESN